MSSVHIYSVGRHLLRHFHRLPPLAQPHCHSLLAPSTPDSESLHPKHATNHVRVG